MIWTLLMLAQPAVPPASAPAASPAAAAAPVAKATGLPEAIRDYFSGSWSGSGQFVSSGKPLESTFTFEPVLDGEALFVRHAEKAPLKFAYMGMWTVDTASGDVVMMLAGNLKGGARLFRSQGWEGDTLTFMPDKSLQTWWAMEKIVFTRESPTRFKAKYQMSRDGGANWRGGDEQTFTKG
jgi:hypothetical protein